MKMITTLPFLCMLIGWIVYAAATTKTWRQFCEDCGRITFFVGLLWLVWAAVGKSLL